MSVMLGIAANMTMPAPINPRDTTHYLNEAKVG